MNKRVTVGVSKGAKCVCGGYSYFDRSQCPAGKWSLFCLFSKQKHLHICGVLKPATCWVRVTSCTRTHKHMFTLSHTHTHTWIQVKKQGCMDNINVRMMCLSTVWCNTHTSYYQMEMKFHRTSKAVWGMSPDVRLQGHHVSAADWRFCPHLCCLWRCLLL